MLKGADRVGKAELEELKPDLDNEVEVELEVKVEAEAKAEVEAEVVVNVEDRGDLEVEANVEANDEVEVKNVGVVDVAVEELAGQDTPVPDSMEAVLLPTGYGAVATRDEEEAKLDKENTDVEVEWLPDASLSRMPCGVPAIALSSGVFSLNTRPLPCTNPARNATKTK